MTLEVVFHSVVIANLALTAWNFHGINFIWERSKEFSSKFHVILYVCDTWNLKNVADVLKKKKKENVSKVLRYLVKIEVVNVKNKLIKCENEESELRC